MDKVDMAICLMIINTKDMLAVREFAFSPLKRSLNFFHGVFTYSFTTETLTARGPLGESSISNSTLSSSFKESNCVFTRLL